MYGHADGYVIPYQWSSNEQVTGYLLYNDDEEDVLIKAEQIPSQILKAGSKVRLFGDIVPNKGIKEISVERFKILIGI